MEGLKIIMWKPIFEQIKHISGSLTEEYMILKGEIIKLGSKRNIKSEKKISIKWVIVYNVINKFGRLCYFIKQIYLTNGFVFFPKYFSILTNLVVMIDNEQYKLHNFIEISKYVLGHINSVNIVQEGLTMIAWLFYYILFALFCLN